MIRVMITSVVLAIMAAIAEVMIRWQLAPEIIRAPQLALAVFANVAVLGMIAACLSATGWGLGRLLTGWMPGLASRVEEYRPSVVIAAVVATLAFLTDGLAVAQSGAGKLLVVPSVLLLGVMAGGYVLHGQRHARAPMSAKVLASAAVVWLLCTIVTASAVGRTSSRIQHWTTDSGNEPPVTPDPAPNIILLVVDTLRADHVGVYGPDGRGLTPHLDHLARSSIVYPHALSTAPWTLPSHASLFTGLYPEIHGVSWGHYELSEGWPVLSELLKAKGYETFAISNNWILSKVNGFGRGFDAFIETATDPHLTSWQLALRCGAARPLVKWVGLAAEVAEDAGSAWTNWLVRKRLTHHDSSQGPVFVFINYFEPHDPYRPPHRLLESRLTSAQQEAYGHLDQREQNLAAQACGSADVFSTEQITLMKRLYKAEVEYQDQMIGELLGILEDADLYENSWIIVTSDHGELFGEWGMVWHTASSHYQLLHVPMIVRPPGGRDGERLEMPVQPVDVFVTLLEETGTEVPPAVRRAYRLPLRPDEQFPRAIAVAQSHGASIAGLSMTQGMNMQADLAHWLTWTNSVYARGYLLETNSAGAHGLFDVIKDPAMDLNQADLEPEKVETMMTAFAGWRRSCGDHDEGGTAEAHARLHLRD